MSVRLYYQNQRRQFPLPLTWPEFEKTIQKIIPHQDHPVFQYKDVDDVWIQFSTALEWDHMMKNHSEAVLQVHMIIDRQKHVGITCDSCQKYEFTGSRYKCSQCYDFDLCASCYEKSDHITGHRFYEMTLTKRLIPCKNDHPYKVHLQVLSGMGFKDTERNLMFLKKFNGHIQLTVNSLTNK